MVSEIILYYLDTMNNDEYDDNSQYDIMIKRQKNMGAPVDVST